MSDPLFDVSDQVVLVSGGSRGIGKAIAAEFAKRDARVIITGRKLDTLESACGEISTGKHPVAFRQNDVSDPHAAKPLVESVVSEFGRIDTLVNVAGVNIRKRVESYTVEEYDHILNINLRGLFFLSQAAGLAMLKRKSGSIINIDSLNTNAPLRGVLPYAISKAGVSMLTRGLAAEWGEDGVRVNAIAPGFILTDLTKKLWSDPTMQAWGLPNTPLRRLGEVDDLPGTAIYLASRASKFMTGQVLYVDGGISAGMRWPIDLGNREHQ